MTIIQSSSSENNMCMRLAWTCSNSTSVWGGFYFSVGTAVIFKFVVCCCCCFPKVIIWIFPMKCFSYLAGDAVCASASWKTGSTCKLLGPQFFPLTFLEQVTRWKGHATVLFHSQAELLEIHTLTSLLPPPLVFQIRSLSFFIPFLNMLRRKSTELS